MLANNTCTVRVDELLTYYTNIFFLNIFIFKKNKIDQRFVKTRHMYKRYKNGFYFSS